MRAKIAFLVVIAFGSGAATGFVVGRAHEAHRVDAIPTRHELLDALAAELSLSVEQRKKIEAISDAHHAELLKVKGSVEPELKKLRVTVRAEMRAVLTDEQKPRFDAFVERRDQQRVAADQ